MEDVNAAASAAAHLGPEALAEAARETGELNDPGPVPESHAPVTWSTLVVYFDPEFGEEPLPHLTSAAHRYDRCRSLLTAGGQALLHRAFLPYPGDDDDPLRWRSGIGAIESVNWRVESPQTGMLHFTAETDLIDRIAEVAFEGFYVATRTDYGPHRPAWFVS